MKPETLELVPPTGNYSEALKMKLGCLAATVLCSAAIGGGPENAAALGNPDPVVGQAQNVTKVQPEITGLGSARSLECGEPGYQAPYQTQIDSMICRFNNVRSVQLTEDPVLDEVAKEKLDDIVACDYDFSHYACGEEPFVHFPPLSPPWIRGEILARGVKVMDPVIQYSAVLGRAHSVFNAWKKSPKHWAVIENERYERVGIALKRLPSASIDGIPRRNVVFWAAEFLGQ